jgi:hypothetical protein
MKASPGNRLAFAVLVLALSVHALAADVITARPSLDTGFKLLYSLDFVRAHDFFSTWQREHPADPMGHVCEAAGILFSEFNRLGILEGQFYANDKVFEARKKLLPDPAARDRFNAALVKAENLARAGIARNPKDRDSLFALTLATGLRADYAALIEKRNMASLHYTRDSTAWAQQLLAVDPQCYDAHLATGISRYIIGSMAAPVRWILRLGGVSGDKKAGIEELRLTADRGQYLAPFARILLAIAYVREKDNSRAREVLASLRDEFPTNPLFAREIARLDSGQ